jgi:N-acetylglutamate synthase-like GNAT family acetyltransferase
MEENEASFCSLWTEHTKIMNCADLFINKRLYEDYFFNRLNNVRCHDLESVIDESRRIFYENGMNCYVYIDDSDTKFEKTLLKRGFILLDTMEVLKSALDNIEYDNHKIQVSKIEVDSLSIWIDVFCRSFEIPNWKTEVERIIRMHFKELTLMLSYIEIDNSITPAGCSVLFNRHNIIGMYCLGTLASFRNQGLAKKMVKVSLQTVRKNNFGFLFLQTFVKEGFTRLYQKIGFEVIYKKKIYTLPKSFA